MSKFLERFRDTLKLYHVLIVHMSMHRHFCWDCWPSEVAMQAQAYVGKVGKVFETFLNLLKDSLVSVLLGGMLHSHQNPLWSTSNHSIAHKNVSFLSSFQSQEKLKTSWGCPVLKSRLKRCSCYTRLPQKSKCNQHMNHILSFLRFPLLFLSSDKIKIF